MNCATGSRILVRALLVVLPLTLPALATAKKEERPGFFWNVETQLRYDDNVYRTHDKFKKSDEIGVIQPKLGWRMLYGKHRFDLGYAGDWGRYFDKTELDYTDHHLKAHALLDHSYRLTSEYTLGYRKDHDRPGGTDAFSFPNRSPDKWWEGYGKGKVSYGRKKSKGQIVGELQYHHRRYTNHDQDYRDYNMVRGTGTFYYRVAPKSRLLFEFSYADYDYQNKDAIGSDQSNQNYRYLTGVTWEATAKTTGILKVGYRETRYDNDRYGDQNGLFLFLDSIWKPNTYTRVTLGASVENQASARQGTNGYVTKAVKGGLSHKITPRIRLIANGRYARDEYDDSFTKDRNDDRWDLRAGVEYSLLRWLDLGAEYRYEERDSNFDIYDYSANVFMIRASTRFE